jgi:DNA-binding CsgD family transcriptional regulator
MSLTQTIDRTNSQALAMALAVLDLTACEEDLLTRAVVRGTVSTSVERHEEWSQVELTAAADGLADRWLVTPEPDGDSVSVVDDVTAAVVEAVQAHERTADRALAAQRESLHASIMSRVRTPPRVLGLQRNVNEEFFDIVRRHTVMVGATPMTALASPAVRQAGRNAALEAQRQHTDPIINVDVVSSRLLKDPIEAKYFTAVDRHPGSSVKVLPELLMRMAVLDGRTAVIPLDSDNPWSGAIVLEDEDAVAHVGLQLAVQVAKARPLLAADTPDLSPRELDVLRLLGQGLTDIAVGRRLWLCDRSVRRLIAALQHKLNVESRFELAVEAGRRGLL